MPPLDRALMVRIAGDRLRRHGPFIETTCGAICAAHAVWRNLAHFEQVSINGAIASGGTLVGPDLEPLIPPRVRAGVPEGLLPLGDAVARGVGDAWRDFQRTFRVPGLPWYPTFAAFPGPAAPPTRNVPTPLSACAHQRALVQGPALREYLTRSLVPAHPAGDELFDALAAALDTVVGLWLNAQMVMNVVGEGPVPSFRPPAVPVGPVVGGRTIAAPGQLAA